MVVITPTLYTEHLSPPISVCHVKISVSIPLNYKLVFDYLLLDYLGCYNDYLRVTNFTRDLNQTMTTLANNSPVACIGYCMSYGWIYAGLQYA